MNLKNQEKLNSGYHTLKNMILGCVGTDVALHPMGNKQKNMVIFVTFY